MNYKEIPGSPIPGSFEGLLKDLLQVKSKNSKRFLFYQRLSMNELNGSIEDPALSISPENATFSEAVPAAENEQTSEPAANITLPSKNNPDEIVSVEKLEKDFDVEFKRPALPVFKSQGNPSKEEEFKICSDSCKILFFSVRTQSKSAV